MDENPSRNLSCKSINLLLLGSSAGIGQQTALDFAKEGASVTVHGLFAGEKNTVHDAEKFLVDAGIPADRFLVVPGPIEAAKTQESIVESTVKKFVRLDVLVNNAAVMKPPGMSIAEMDTLWNASTTCSL
ncbi:Protein F02C12.2 [Aphelenchoides avenae]|nr:Protein F02C12.2 [Aphelenchus avenae]